MSHLTMSAFHGIQSHTRKQLHILIADKVRSGKRRKRGLARRKSTAIGMRVRRCIAGDVLHISLLVMQLLFVQAKPAVVREYTG